jgi:hypothetical protein
VLSTWGAYGSQRDKIDEIRQVDLLSRSGRGEYMKKFIIRIAIRNTVMFRYSILFFQRRALLAFTLQISHTVYHQWSCHDPDNNVHDK